jgi:fructose-bisphosphate aldolase, class II
MLINMKELLKVSQKNKFAVGAFNIGNGELLRTVMDTAVGKSAPVILAIHPTELDFVTDHFICFCRRYAYESKIPVVIHLDHGATMEQVLHAIKCGFTSVMIDGSLLPYEENIALTKQVVDIAHAINVSVEGELGTIGQTGESIEGGTTEIVYTNPETAKDYVERTGIDSLAVAIGTAHGIYPKAMIPKLRLDLLSKIAANVSIPLVLHGGSSNPDNEISQAVSLGVCKVNISSDMKYAFYKKAREILNENPSMLEPNAIYPKCMEEAKKVIEHKMDLFHSINKAGLYV